MRRAQRDGQRMATLAAKWDARTIRGYDPVEHTTAAPADPKQAKVSGAAVHTGCGHSLLTGTHTHAHSLCKL